MNYAEKWNAKLVEVIPDVEGTYSLCATPSIVPISEFEDFEEFILKSVDKCETLEKVELTHNNTTVVIYRHTGNMTAMIVFLADDFTDEIPISDKDLAEIFKQNDIGVKFFYPYNNVVEYASNVGDDYSCFNIAKDISQFGYDSGSYITIKVPGNAFTSPLKIKDMNDETHSKTFHSVAIIGNSVYDIEHGYFNCDIYQYMNMLFKANGSIRLDAEKTHLSESWIIDMIEDEKAFWALLLDKNRYDEAKDYLTRILDMCTEE